MASVFHKSSRDCGDWKIKTCLDDLLKSITFKVMESNLKYRNHTQNIIKQFVEFESLPKQIEGNKISQWFNCGENIFLEFYYLGISVKWNLSDIKKEHTDLDDIISRVSKNQGWLQSFITIYPGLRIDLEGATPAVDVCRVRSGIEFLLQGFCGVNDTFDKVLTDLKELGELEEFDEHLRIWAAEYRPHFFPGDRHINTPRSHWWWC